MWTASMALAEHQPNSNLLFPQRLQAIFNPLAQTCVVAIEVDARHSPCPMPLLKAKQALRGLTENQRIRVIASDPGSLKDFVAFAELAKHKIDYFFADNNFYYYVLQKNPTDSQ